MFSGFRNSWALVKASAGVLRADKELIVFPILSGAAQMVVLASFFLPLLLSGVFDSFLFKGIQLLGFLGGLSFYAVEAFVVLFVNSALIGAAMIRLRGASLPVRIPSQARSKTQQKRGYDVYENKENGSG